MPFWMISHRKNHVTGGGGGGGGGGWGGGGGGGVWGGGGGGGVLSEKQLERAREIERAKAALCHGRLQMWRKDKKKQRTIKEKKRHHEPLQSKESSLLRGGERLCEEWKNAAKGGKSVLSLMKKRTT